MRKQHRSVHPWLWVVTAMVSLSVLAWAVLNRTDPTPDQPAPDFDTGARP